jgi:hypothetical protein
MPVPSQQMLSNFFDSVAFSHPFTAELMVDDIMEVAVWGLSSDSSPAQGAADRLRQQAQNLPEIHRRMLDNTLIQLGYK